MIFVRTEAMCFHPAAGRGWQTLLTISSGKWPRCGCRPFRFFRLQPGFRNQQGYRPAGPGHDVAHFLFVVDFEIAGNGHGKYPEGGKAAGDDVAFDHPLPVLGKVLYPDCPVGHAGGNEPGRGQAEQADSENKAVLNEYIVGDGQDRRGNGGHQDRDQVDPPGGPVNTGVFFADSREKLEGSGQDGKGAEENVNRQQGTEWLVPGLPVEMPEGELVDEIEIDQDDEGPGDGCEGFFGHGDGVIDSISER